MKTREWCARVTSTLCFRLNTVAHNIPRSVYTTATFFLESHYAKCAENICGGRRDQETSHYDATMAHKVAINETTEPSAGCAKEQRRLHEGIRVIYRVRL